MNELGPEMFAEWATGAETIAPAPRNRRCEGYVYFIGGDTDCIKIGFAKDPQKRLRSLQTGSPVPLYILACVEGDAVHEKEYHRKFRADWSHGEWFRKTPRLLALIDAISREGNYQRQIRGLPNL